MNTITRLRLTVLTLTLTAAAAAAAEPLTYKDLVHRLTDMEHLAVLPLAGEKGGFGKQLRQE